MTDTELSAIRARCEAATPGPWAFGNYPLGDGLSIIGSDGYIVVDDGSVGGEYESSTTLEDMRFIRDARKDIPALLAHIEEQRKESEHLRRALGRLAEKTAHACATAVGCPFAGPCPADGTRCLDIQAEDWLKAAFNATKEAASE